MFEQRAVPAHRKIAVAVLVEESGSMKGDKIVAARRTAILVREAMHSLENVELFIYGHTADKPDRTTNIFRYLRPGWRRKHSLGSVASRSNNRDGAAILAVRCRDIVLLVISDGQPQATGYKGMPAVRHTRSVVQQLQKQMTVIQVALDPVVDSSRMFDNHVRFTELDRVPDQVGKLIRKLVR